MDGIEKVATLEWAYAKAKELGVEDEFRAVIAEAEKKIEEMNGETK